MNSRAAELSVAYNAARPRLVRVAYAVLGSRAEAEDAVSDCWLRLVAADARTRVKDVEAWSTVAVARVALDVLRSARVRRELYLGPWLPEPLVEAGPFEGDPADRVTLDDTISYALMVVLESLSPAERTAWVLHDVFGMPFTEVARTVGRTPAAVRQLAVRARRHVGERAPRAEVGAAEHAAVVTRFLDAAVGGDLGGLLRALDPDVVLTTDGGGQVSAALRPVHGADRVARFLQGVAAKTQPHERIGVIVVNGALGIGVFDGERLTTVVSFTVAERGVVRVDVVRAPDKLPPVCPS
ncbi:RNA polymerase sigma factor SigJ [Streptomyces sp. NPDC046977]|uniref:RNA polymerase sigma factor SigJ n=1 Tax=Streptomyces sp. NPDC046977 TaxID=3154703 RepID=UPI0033FD596E